MIYGRLAVALRKRPRLRPWHLLVAVALGLVAIMYSPDREDPLDGEVKGAFTQQEHDPSANPLHHAASEGDTERVIELLGSGVDIESMDEQGMTPLLVASAHGHVEVAKALLEAGAKVDNMKKYRYTALHAAVVEGQAETVELLVASGADMDIPDGYRKNTPMHWAAHHGHIDIVRNLLSSGAEVDSLTWATPLGIASREGELEAVRLLLAAGADPDGRADGDKVYTPLAMATGSGHKEVVEALLASGAGVNVGSGFGKTPISWAAKKGHDELALLLLAAGAEVDHADNIGQTPLHFVSLAIFHDHAKKAPEALAILLAAGADPDRKVVYSKHDSFFKGRLAATADRVAMLADGSIKMPGSNEFWVRPLYYPLLTLDKGIMRALLEGGADPDADFHNGAGILHYVVELADSVELAELLLGHGADVDIRDLSGSTPLHYAAYLGLDEMAGFLLESGADPNARNVAGMAPLDYASCLGSGSTQGLLVKHGARPAARDAGEVCEVLLNGDNEAWVWLESRLGLVPMGLGHLAENELWPYHSARKPSLTTRIKLIPAKAFLSMR